MLPKTWRRIVMLRYSTFNHLPHYLHLPHHLHIPLGAPILHVALQPWGETSDTATVAVSTRGVPLLIWKIFFIFSISSETSRFVTATVAAFDVSPNDLSRNVKYCSTMVHFMLTANFVYIVYFFPAFSQRMYDINGRYQMQGGTSKSSATSQRAFKFLVANIT